MKNIFYAFWLCCLFGTAYAQFPTGTIPFQNNTGSVFEGKYENAKGSNSTITKLLGQNGGQFSVQLAAVDDNVYEASGKITYETQEGDGCVINFSVNLDFHQSSTASWSITPEVLGVGKVLCAVSGRPGGDNDLTAPTVIISNAVKE